MIIAIIIGIFIVNNQSTVKQITKLTSVEQAMFSNEVPHNGIYLKRSNVKYYEGEAGYDEGWCDYDRDGFLTINDYHIRGYQEESFKNTDFCRKILLGESMQISKVFVGEKLDIRYLLLRDDNTVKDDAALRQCVIESKNNNSTSYSTRYTNNQFIITFNEAGQYTISLGEVAGVKINVSDYEKEEVSIASDKTQASEDNYTPTVGDIDGDGFISHWDVLYLSEYLKGNNNYPISDEKIADISNDGSIDRIDLEILKQAIKNKGNAYLPKLQTREIHPGEEIIYRIVDFAGRNVTDKLAITSDGVLAIKNFNNGTIKIVASEPGNGKIFINNQELISLVVSKEAAEEDDDNNASETYSAYVLNRTVNKGKTKGDIDGDGFITYKDAKILNDVARNLVGDEYEYKKDEYKYSEDINDDDKIQSIDSSLLNSMVNQKSKNYLDQVYPVLKGEEIEIQAINVDGTDQKENITFRIDQDSEQQAGATLTRENDGKAKFVGNQSGTYSIYINDKLIFRIIVSDIGGVYAPQRTVNSEKSRGDLNGDGFITHKDFRILKDVDRFGIDTNIICADIDGDKRITATDFSKLKAAVTGKENAKNEFETFQVYPVIKGEEIILQATDDNGENLYGGVTFAVEQNSGLQILNQTEGKATIKANRSGTYKVLLNNKEVYSLKVEEKPILKIEGEVVEPNTRDNPYVYKGKINVLLESAQHHFNIEDITEKDSVNVSYHDRGYTVSNAGTYVIHVLNKDNGEEEIYRAYVKIEEPVLKINDKEVTKNTRDNPYEYIGETIVKLEDERYMFNIEDISDETENVSYFDNIFTLNKQGLYYIEVIDKDTRKTNYIVYARISNVIKPTIQIIGTKGENEYYKGNVEIKITAGSDDISRGAYSLYNDYDDETEAGEDIAGTTFSYQNDKTYTINIYDLQKEYPYTLFVWNYSDGIQSEKARINFLIDGVAPSKVAPNATSTKNSITVTSAQEDAVSGINSIQYAILKNGTWSSWQNENVFKELNPNTEYKVKTKAIDKAGNVSESEPKTVQTKQNESKVITITLNGANPLEIEQGETFVEPGAVIKDDKENIIDAAVVITGTVNTSVKGRYELKYNFTDNYGNKAPEVIRIVNVVERTGKVVSVKLDINKLELKVGQMDKLNAIIEPEDAKNKKVTWKSSNEKVATVDENGYVKAVAAGNATITVTTQDGNFSDRCDITVKQAQTNDIIFNSNVYYILNRASKIMNISPNTTYEQFTKDILANVKYKVVNGKNKEISKTEIIGTGMKVILETDDKREYNIVVKGDINGDGLITISDLSKLKKNLIKLIELNEIEQNGADIDMDGQLTISDLSKMIKYIIGLLNF